MKDSLTRIFSVLSFFPFINFGANTEVIPVASLMLVFLVRHKIRSIIFVIGLGLIFLLLSFLGDHNGPVFSNLVLSFVLLGHVLLSTSNLNMNYKLLSIVNRAWFGVIVASNFNLITQWEVLEGSLLRRVYTCDLPFTCARGGSGLAPEPAYAATVLVFLGMYFALALRSENKKAAKVDILIICCSLILLNAVISYIFLVVLVAGLAVQNLRLKSIGILVILAVLGVSTALRNERVQTLVDNISGSRATTYIFAPLVAMGSTREIGVFCAYTTAKFLELSQQKQSSSFKACQRENFWLGSNRELIDSGHKPYSPIAFVFLYYGVFPGALLLGLLLLVFRPFSQGRKGLFIATVLLLICLRVTVAFPIPFVILPLMQKLQDRRSTEKVRAKLKSSQETPGTHTSRPARTF